MWREINLQILILWISSMVPKGTGIAFPNKITDPPKIECMVDGIRMSVHANHGNPSHMFVKGRHHEQRCLTRNRNAIKIQHEECGLERERTLNPPGVSYRVCIVVQLHPQFITKVDKTFCPSCFYREYVKDVQQELGVSVVPYTEVSIKVPMPTCSYSIRRGSPTGPEIRFATVGEPVYHVWTCPSDHYGMLVQKCYVDDGQGNRILIVDEHGCGVDRYIVQTPKYNDEMTMAFQESHVFKFADKTITRFTCSIKVCIKAGSGCRGITPPSNCPNFGSGAFTGQKPGFKAPHYPSARSQAKHRGARDLGWQAGFVPTNQSFSHLNSDLGDDTMDVSGELIVLENVGQGSDFFERLNSGRNTEIKEIVSRPEGSVCVSTVGFVMLMVFGSFVLVGITGSMLFFLWKNKTHKKFQASSSSSSLCSSGLR